MAFQRDTLVKTNYYNSDRGFYGSFVPAKILAYNEELGSYKVIARNENNGMVWIENVLRENIRGIRPRRAHCSICLEVLRDNRKPLITKCGHVYCVNCINEVIYRQNVPKCPECMTRVQEDELQSPKFLDDDDYVICVECYQFTDKNIEPRKYEINVYEEIPYDYEDGTEGTIRYRVCLCICDFCAWDNGMRNNPRVFIK